MKKISIIALVGIAIITISSFSFCTGTHGQEDNTIAEATTKPVSEKEVKEKAQEQESQEISPKTKEEGGMTWYLDLKEAHKVSETSGKPILGFFTGSDWCGWCIKLQKNVLHTDEFKAWAKDNVVLLELDFPRRTKLPTALAQQNRNLQQVFQVSGYPTVWYFTGEENKETGQLNLSALGKTGYPRATPGQEARAFIDASEGIILKN